MNRERETEKGKTAETKDKDGKRKEEKFGKIGRVIVLSFLTISVLIFESFSFFYGLNK